MAKRLLGLIILVLLLLMPTYILANEIKTIIIIVDELPFSRINDLDIDNYNLGLVNIKGRPPYSIKGLLLSINTGQKIDQKDLQKEYSNLEYLGDCLKKEKTSFIGDDNDSLIVTDSKGEVPYKADSIIYDLDWLIANTNKLLAKSSLLGISYEFNNIPNRVQVLKSYLKLNNDKTIFILPKTIAKKDSYLINKYLVPILYINGRDLGILTSLSTKRKGIITIEDISAHIKESYGHFNMSNIGRRIEVIPLDNPLNKTIKIYNKTMNLLVITYVFHGIIYLIQIILGIWIFKTSKIPKWSFQVYLIASISIFSSLLLGLFQFHNNIFIYFFAIILIMLIIFKFLANKKESIFIIGLLTYSSIVFGIIFFPDMIYNSFVGFNNLVYGARYYGFNNCIAAVLLGNSILVFYKSEQMIKSKKIKLIITSILFSSNIIILSTGFGTNFGGFITSIILFGLVVNTYILAGYQTIKRVIIFMIFIVLILLSSKFIYNSINIDSHLFKFIYRLKENGVEEFVQVAYFKIKENLSLGIRLPFSIAIISQVVILRKLIGSFKYDEIKKSKTKLIIIVALLGFILNDTGFIFLIYIFQYFILDMLNEIRIDDRITP